MLGGGAHRAAGGAGPDCALAYPVGVESGGNQALTRAAAAAALAALLGAAMLLAGPGAERSGAAKAGSSERQPINKRHRGIDVSRFQGKINWKQVGRKTKVTFGWAQASRGSGSDCLVAPTECGPDQTWKRNYRGARANGIHIGAYHRTFASGKTVKLAKRDARREAKVFLNTVKRVRGKDLIPALDMESPFKNLNPKRLKIWIQVWLDKVEEGLGVRPIIYTNVESWSHTKHTLKFPRAGYRLWVANFDVKEPLVPAQNWGGRGWKVWQHTSTGSVKGIQGNVDKNKLSGSLRGLLVSTHRTKSSGGPADEGSGDGTPLPPRSGGVGAR